MLKKFIVLAVVLLVTGCTANNKVTQKQVTPKQTRISNHVHTAAPTPVITQASSTATSNITTKGAQNGYPSDLLGLIQTPTGNPTNQQPTGNSGEKVPTSPTSPTSPTGQAQEGTKDSSQFAEQVLDLVNKERSKAGLGSLSMSEELSKMAMVKAQDMYNNNYFDHNSPTHGSPFDMMKEFGITYNSAGENIAKGQTTPTQVMNEWMNSPGHKANILNSSYTRIGISYYNKEWVQEFTG
ncbi:CAP domain-containing protein [Paenibacillus macquariensis]|uniref:Uncharacterized protein, YkwD family n=1 Tax=Paenibacillus macquariensis TaxID=948756 RepID=A0ABY1KF97_9BACL|nr:CAP domain-containing protein [Paenibacillus macquariensis]MEC0093872.1 CAP domain-containing protein [Paenibacillus macquariensis]OAB33065.1 hypothetical protein PMSM_16020 [Paenibacillus macquariensis subsp. macquariensis]SIR59344.1 uncharacterized protein, YkwD family [Paenibacillus macquariensis]